MKRKASAQWRGSLKDGKGPSDHAPLVVDLTL